MKLDNVKARHNNALLETARLFADDGHLISLDDLVTAFTSNKCRIVCQFQGYNVHGENVRTKLFVDTEPPAGVHDVKTCFDRVWIKTPETLDEVIHAAKFGTRKMNDAESEWWLKKRE